MKSEAKKLQLIEAIIKIPNEATLMEIEAVIKKSVQFKKSKRASAHDFSGLISEEDASLMNAAINDSRHQR